MLIQILLVLLVAVIAFFLVDRVGFPGDIGWIVKAIIFVVALWFVLPMVGVALPF